VTVVSAIWWLYNRTVTIGRDLHTEWRDWCAGYGYGNEQSLWGWRTGCLQYRKGRKRL